MDVYSAKNHLDFLNARLKAGKIKCRYGILRRISAALKCHPTFISQVFRGKANLSTDQALLLCDFLTMSNAETKFFLDLLQRDRAGNLVARAYFEKKLAQQRKEREDLLKRLQMKSEAPLEALAAYTADWICQAIFTVLDLPKMDQVSTIADYLGLSPRIVEKALKRMEKARIVMQNRDGRWNCTLEAIVIERGSDFINAFLRNWRIKAISAIDEREPITASGPISSNTKQDVPDLHFSQSVCLSYEEARQFRAILVKALEKIARHESSPQSEVAQVICVDFFGLTR